MGKFRKDIFHLIPLLEKKKKEKRKAGGCSSY